MDRMRSDCCLFTVGGALLHHRRSVLGHHLVYRPAALGGVSSAPILRSYNRWHGEMRSVMAAINLFILNIVGLGLGPVGVGFISDLLLSLALKASATDCSPH